MVASAAADAEDVGDGVEDSLEASLAASAAATAAAAAAGAENAALGRPLDGASDSLRGARSFLTNYLNQKPFSRTSRNQGGRLQ